MPDQINDTERRIQPTVERESGERPAGYSMIHQGNSTNALARITKAEAREDPISGKSIITVKGLSVTLPAELLPHLKTSTLQLLDILAITLTQSNKATPTVTLTLDDYMHRRGLSDRKEAKKQIEADLKVLRGTFITFDDRDPETGKPVTYGQINISDSWIWQDRQRTAVKYTFGATFFNVLRSYPTMPYAPQLLTISNKKHPYSFRLGRFLSEHKNMNIEKKNEDLIKVETLLKAAKFPTAEEVKKIDRAYSRRIIEPFERDMDALGDMFSWEYCHSGGAVLTDAEREDFQYSLFIELLVKITWKDYPEQQERRKQIIAAQRRKNRAAPRKRKPAAGKG
jgi:hypothetical protein